MVFNIDTFMSMGTSTGAAFGVPSCIMNLGLRVLSLLPTPVLALMLSMLEAGIELADSIIKAVFQELRNLFGLIEWLTTEGLFSFVSGFFKYGLGGALGAIIAAIGALTEAANALGNIYANYQALVAEIESIKECIDNFKNFLKSKHSISDNIPTDPEAFQNFIDENFAVQKLQVEAATNFISDATDQINAITGIIAERQRNPTSVPQFNSEACQYLQGTIFEQYCVAAQEAEKEIFRLVYGPPKSTQGQFILSNDGLYFDSQSSGISPALTYVKAKQNEIAASERWKFIQNPNVGGRGKGVSINDLKDYINTTLDPKIINDTVSIQNYYDKDGFLQDLIGNRNKRMYDLSGQLSDLELDSAPTSIILNFKQSMISENAQFTDKINKRKKQIELAVVLPVLYGTRIRYNPGEVPINDFSYLGGLNISLDVQKQKALLFSQVDISGVVSPIQTKLTTTNFKVHNKNSTLEHLIIAEDGAGAIIFDGSSVSSTDAVILQTENSLTTDGLFAMYNFLETDYQDPSSTLFTTRNSASITDALYAQLVTKDSGSVFSRGLGIPYFEGITKHSQTNPTAPSALGSFLRLPSSKEFNDLLYNPDGATIDFWTHVPNLDSISTGYDIGSVSGLYRLILSNENVGYIGTGTNTDTEYAPVNTNGTNVRGFMMGFTRDRRIVSSLPASNNNDDNPATETVFFLAPTQSITASSAGLINRSYFDSDGCTTNTSYHSMIVPINQVINGASLSACQYDFCHVAVTFDPKMDEINFYLDGNKIVTSSISYVFGIPKYRMPELPTFKVGNSFEYNTTSVGPLAPNSLKYGPKLDTFFTPWVVGGGYTDGLYNKGNFMGGTYGGLISGLKGYLGSLKFYSKPLTPSQVLSNYKTQKNFFKNIDTLTLGWEDIVSL